LQPLIEDNIPVFIKKYIWAKCRRYLYIKFHKTW
jgi:hypothetical protein